MVGVSTRDGRGYGEETRNTNIRKRQNGREAKTAASGVSLLKSLQKACVTPLLVCII